MQCPRSSEAHAKLRRVAAGALAAFTAVLGLSRLLAGSPADSPRIFYTSEQAVIFQLRRLKNEQLVLVERSDEDQKYRPVYEFMLTREGLDRRFRDEALAALAKLGGRDPIEELLDGLRRIDGPASPGALRDLSAMLLGRDAGDLGRRRSRLEAVAIGAASREARRVAFTALAACTPADEVWDIASVRATRLIEFLDCLPRLSRAHRAPFLAKITSLLEGDDAPALRRAAILALPGFPGHEDECFTALARLIREGIETEASARSLRGLPRSAWSRGDAVGLARAILARAAAIAEDERTTAAFFDSLQLAHELSLMLPPEESRRVRDRVRELGLRATPWKLEDLVPHLPELSRERSEAGREVFASAGCIQCHGVGDEGGAAFGPTLDGVFERWKGSRSDLLREILEPSRTIEEKYRNQVFVLKTGRVVSGLITAEGPTTITVQSGPAIALAQDVERDEIVERRPQSVSIMPTGLLDPLPRERILDLLSFLEFAAPSAGR